MTTREIMELVYQEAGEPSDLCPYTDPGDYTTFDIALAGSVRLLRIVNMALRRVASWKLRSGRILRHKALEAREFFTIPDAPTGTVVSATDTTVTIPQLGSDADGELDGWVIEITDGLGSGQTRLIVGSTVAGGNIIASVVSAWDTNPDNTSTYSLYKSHVFLRAVRTLTAHTWDFLLDPATKLHDIVRIRDVVTGVDLLLPNHGDTFSASQAQSGVPTLYQRYGDQILFDAAISSRRTYEMLFMRQPTPLTAETQVPELMEIFHQPIILWAVHEIQRMNQAFGPAYATKRELEDMMEMIVQQGTYELTMEQTGIVAYG